MHEDDWLEAAYEERYEFPDEEDWYYDEPIDRAFCDNYDPHGPHIYSAINGNLYDCSGLTQEQLDEIEAYDPGTCEHGLSADDCGGPEHWYD